MSETQRPRMWERVGECAPYPADAPVRVEPDYDLGWLVEAVNDGEYETEAYCGRDRELAISEGVRVARERGARLHIYYRWDPDFNHALEGRERPVGGGRGRWVTRDWSGWSTARPATGRTRKCSSTGVTKDGGDYYFCPATAKPVSLPVSARA